MPQDSIPLQTRPPTRLASTLLANPDADGFTVLAVDDHASPSPRPYSVSVPWESLFTFLSSKASRDVLPLSLLAPLVATIANSNGSSTHDQDVPASPHQLSSNFLRYSSSYAERFSSPTVMSSKSEPVTNSRNESDFVSSPHLSLVDFTDNSSKNDSDNTSEIRPVKAIPEHLLNRRHTVSSADNNNTNSNTSKNDDNTNNSITSTPTSATSSTAPNSATKETKPSERRRNSHDETYLWDSLYDRLVPIMPNEMSLRVWHPHDQIITFPAASFIEVREKDGSRASPCNLHSNEWIKGQVCGSTCSHRDGFGAKRPILIREHIRKCSSLAPDDPLKVLCVLELAAHNRASRQNRLRLKRRREDFERSTFDLPFNAVNMSPMSYGHMRQLQQQHQSSPLQVNSGTPVDGSQMVQFGIPYNNTSPSMLCPPMQHPGVSVLSNSAGGVTQQQSANGVPARASSLPLGAEPRYLASSMPMQISGSQWSTPEQANNAAAAAAANGVSGVPGYPTAPLFPFDANNFTENRQATPSQDDESAADSARDARRHTISSGPESNGFYATYSYNQLSDESRASSNPPHMIQSNPNEKQPNDTNSMAYYLAEVDNRGYFASGLGVDFRNDGSANNNNVSASIETSSAPAVSSAAASELLPPFASPPPQTQQQNNSASNNNTANFGSRRDLISMASDIKANSPLLVFGDIHAPSSSSSMFTSQAMAVVPPPISSSS